MNAARPRRRRRGLATAVLVLAVAQALSGCATKRRTEGLLPLELYGAAGDWTGAIRAGGFELTGADWSVRVPRPDVLSVGKRTVLLNTPTGDGRYVSLWLEPGPCEAAGRSFPYRVSACIAPDDDRYACTRRIKGCARPDARPSTR